MSAITLFLAQFIAACLIAALFAVTLSFVYWIIGEPRGKVGEPGKGNFVIGRIFSFYGRFILERFEAFEERESKRISDKYKKYYNNRKKRYDEAVAIAEQNLTGEQLSDKLDALETEFTTDTIKANRRLQARRRLNIFSALGACPICFKTWLSVACWVTFAILVPAPINLFLVVFSVPLSVIFSNRIKVG